MHSVYNGCSVCVGVLSSCLVCAWEYSLAVPVQRHLIGRPQEGMCVYKETMGVYALCVCGCFILVVWSSLECSLAVPVQRHLIGRPQEGMCVYKETMGVCVCTVCVWMFYPVV